MACNKHFDFRKTETSGIAIIKEHLFVLNKYLNVLEIQNWKTLGKLKPRLSRSKCYPEDILKDRERKLIS